MIMIGTEVIGYDRPKWVWVMDGKREGGEEMWLMIDYDCISLAFCGALFYCY